MNNIDELKSLSDDELLHRVSDLLAQSRRVEWVLVAHIAEVDARRLYARQASPSMIQYCMEALHLSEGEAYRRIAAARLSRKYPVILTMLEDGRLHLCGIGVLSRHLTDANYEDVLARATHKTKREIEKLMAELAPKPDVPPTIRKRPQRKASSAPPKSANELYPDRVEQNAPPAEPALPAAPEKPATVEPLAKARYTSCGSATRGNVRLSAKTAGAARRVRDWSSTTTSPMASAAIEARRIFGFAAKPTTFTWLSFTTGKKRWTATVCVSRHLLLSSVQTESIENRTSVSATA